jgi:electron transport complex protein RnfC
LCIIIEADDSFDEEFMTPMDPFTCTKEEALARIREAGILGLGGAGFPTYVKLSPPPGKQIDLIIADGAECEPYLTADDAVMTARPDLLVKGLEIVMRLTNVNRAIIGIEDNKERLIPLIERELRVRDLHNISIGLCRTRYPQGGEKMLITALTGREVPSGGLPMDVGCIVQNVGTLIAIAEAFTLGKPLIDRILTVSGNACKTPENICVPVGTSLKDLPPELINIDFSRLAKIVFGGPMMGFAVHSLEIPIQKNTSGIVLMTTEKNETTADLEGPCISCCRCCKLCLR